MARWSPDFQKCLPGFFPRHFQILPDSRARPILSAKQIGLSQNLEMLALLLMLVSFCATALASAEQNQQRSGGGSHFVFNSLLPTRTRADQRHSSSPTTNTTPILEIRQDLTITLITSTPIAETLILKESETILIQFSTTITLTDSAEVTFPIHRAPGHPGPIHTSSASSVNPGTSF
jgi:hypothetical protein